MLVFACSSVGADDPAATSGLSSSEIQPDPSSARQGLIPTRAGLQLVVKADCGNIQIFTDMLASVSYAVRPDPRVAGGEPNSLKDFLLMARKTSRGVMLIGQTQRPGCRGNLVYEIHVPSRYDLDIAVQSGDIATQDIDGIVVLSTGGGAVRAGSIGMSDAAATTLENAAFVARLETAGGDICVGNIAGGLRAATAGGQISAGDVHGPALLRTGGGDIHVGHVFGGAHFTSGGGDIVAQKVDGGVRADTAGGRVEIGKAVRLAAVPPQPAAGGKDAFPSAMPRDPEDQQGMPAITNLTDVTEWARLFDAFLWGGIRVDPADQQKRLLDSVVPEYPDIARLAGIEGVVTLRIFVGRDGTIRGITPVSGPPVLARAAMHAVERWRYAPALIDGHPVDLVTTVTLAFRLHP